MSGVESTRYIHTSGLSCDASLKMTAASFGEPPGAPGGSRFAFFSPSSLSIFYDQISVPSSHKIHPGLILTSRFRNRASAFHLLLTKSLHTSSAFVFTVVTRDDTPRTCGPLPVLAALRRRSAKDSPPREAAPRIETGSADEGALILPAS